MTERRIFSHVREIELSGAKFDTGDGRKYLHEVLPNIRQILLGRVSPLGEIIPLLNPQAQSETPIEGNFEGIITGLYPLALKKFAQDKAEREREFAAESLSYAYKNELKPAIKEGTFGDNSDLGIFLEVFIKRFGKHDLETIYEQLNELGFIRNADGNIAFDWEMASRLMRVLFNLPIDHGHISKNFPVRASEELVDDLNLWCVDYLKGLISTISRERNVDRETAYRVRNNGERIFTREELEKLNALAQKTLQFSEDVGQMSNLTDVMEWVKTTFEGRSLEDILIINPELPRLR